MPLPRMQKAAHISFVCFRNLPGLLYVFYFHVFFREYEPDFFYQESCKNWPVLSDSFKPICGNVYGKVSEDSRRKVV